MDKDKFTFGLEVKMVPRCGLGRSRVSKSPALWIRRTAKVGSKGRNIQIPACPQGREVVFLVASFVFALITVATLGSILSMNKQGL